MYLLGDKGVDSLTSFQLTEYEAKIYETVREQEQLNKRVQEHYESVDDFITSQYCLSENFKFRALTEEMIRYRITVGILDENLSERLQLNSELTL